jgi:hypothetical protein
MTTSNEGLGELAIALAKAQMEFLPVVKNREVKAGGRYSFRYADLQALLEATRPALSANGLTIVQTVGDGELTTMLLHASGAYISSSAKFPTDGNMQEMGKNITYMRRYQYSAMLSLASEDDNDGAGEQGARDLPKRTPASVDRDTGEIASLLTEDGRSWALDAAWTREQVAAAWDAATDGAVAYKAWWERQPLEFRTSALQSKNNHQGMWTIAKQADGVEAMPPAGKRAKQAKVTTS